jgi:hypothetical protein
MSAKQCAAAALSLVAQNRYNNLGAPTNFVWLGLIFVFSALRECSADFSGLFYCVLCGAGGGFARSSGSRFPV